MAVTLQIVGLFYNQTINTGNLTATGSPRTYTVQQIMDAAADNQVSVDSPAVAPAFDYAYSTNSFVSDDILSSPNAPPDTAAPYVDFIAATYASPFTSSRSDITYPAGTYVLAQTASQFNAPSYTVWQFYILDSSGSMVSGGITSFTKQEVTDGQTIIWRLVSICSGPTPLNPRAAALFNPNPVQS